jgi:cytochrome P450
LPPELFVPPFPPRGKGPVATWRGFVGERARNAIHGWSEQAFVVRHIYRRILHLRVHVPLDPDSVQRVLLDNASNYVKPKLVRKLVGPTIGRGLLMADGELWREQRRIVAASFAPAAVEDLVPHFAAAASQRARPWQNGVVRDMAAESTATTMAIIADTLFSGDPRLKTAQAMAHITAALDAALEARINVILGLPRIGWTKKMRRGRKGQEFLRKTLGEVVRDRLPHGGGDFLGKIISALRERFPAEEATELAIDNAATFYLAGHETTANAITWTLYLLAEQPQLQDRVAREAQAALSAAAFDPEALPLLRAVIEESMRLYPPVPRFDREAVAPDRLGEVEIRAGDIVSIWPWLIHRHKALWNDPDSFDAGRFSPERRPRQHRFQYLPFGGGPRVCVGARFAMSEALAVLATWIASWSFTPLPGNRVRPLGTVTLRPEGGLPLHIKARS